MLAKLHLNLKRVINGNDKYFVSFVIGVPNHQYYSNYQTHATIFTQTHKITYSKCMIQKKLNQSFMIHDIQWNSYHSQHRERHPHPTTPSESSCCINGPSTSPGAICIHRKALAIASCSVVMDICIQIILRHYYLKSRCHLLGVIKCLNVI